MVGAKSKNLAGLRGRLPDWISLPSSVTVPFSSFEEALKRGQHNKQLAKQLNEAIREVQPSNASAALARCRDLVMQVGQGGIGWVRLLGTALAVPVLVVATG